MRRSGITIIPSYVLASRIARYEKLNGIQSATVYVPISITVVDVQTPFPIIGPTYTTVSGVRVLAGSFIVDYAIGAERTQAQVSGEFDPLEKFDGTPFNGKGKKTDILVKRGSTVLIRNVDYVLSEVANEPKSGINGVLNNTRGTRVQIQFTDTFPAGTHTVTINAGVGGKYSPFDLTLSRQ